MRQIAARKLREGDVVRLATGGGGGFGPAIDRDPQHVAADVRNELVTIEQAQQLYAVVVDSETLQVDQESTATLRKKQKRTQKPSTGI